MSAHNPMSAGGPDTRARPLHGFETVWHPALRARLLEHTDGVGTDGARVNRDVRHTNRSLRRIVLEAAAGGTIAGLAAGLSVYGMLTALAAVGR